MQGVREESGVNHKKEEKEMNLEKACISLHSLFLLREFFFSKESGEESGVNHKKEKDLFPKPWVTLSNLE